MTRWLSVMANWPSKKKELRGSVAIQLGLPRPALRNADCVVLEVSLARLISSFLISNGPREFKFAKGQQIQPWLPSFQASAYDGQSRVRSGDHQDDDQSP